MFFFLTDNCQGVCFLHPVPRSTNPPGTTTVTKIVTTKGKTSTERDIAAVSGKIADWLTILIDWGYIKEQLPKISLILFVCLFVCFFGFVLFCFCFCVCSDLLLFVSCVFVFIRSCFTSTCLFMFLVLFHLVVLPVCFFARRWCCFVFVCVAEFKGPLCIWYWFSFFSFFCTLEGWTVGIEFCQIIQGHYLWLVLQSLDISRLTSLEIWKYKRI